MLFHHEAAPCMVPCMIPCMVPSCNSVLGFRKVVQDIGSLQGFHTVTLQWSHAVDLKWYAPRVQRVVPCHGFMHWSPRTSYSYLVTKQWFPIYRYYSSNSVLTVLPLHTAKHIHQHRHSIFFVLCF
jgi:hypothetical protein